MRIYQVHYTKNDRSNGYSFHADAKEARRAAKEDRKPYDEIHQIDVEISKRGILMALNTYGGHPDNPV